METIVEQEGHYRRLFEAPRPRSVRIKTLNCIWLVAFPGAAVLVIYFGVQEALRLRQLGTDSALSVGAMFDFVFSAVMLTASSVIFWIVRRDKKLLKDGELAVGVVTHQKLVKTGGRGGRRTQSKVRYRFKDSSGQLYQGTGTDHSRDLRVEMTVPVFYDPEDPDKNVALCTASCELRSN
jgi:hypothetical protein